jgi:hypothetical protein
VVVVAGLLVVVVVVGALVFFVAGGFVVVVVGVGGAVVLPAGSLKSNRFGLPDPESVTTPVVADVTMRFATSAGVSVGRCPSSTAAAPATCGAANDVPEVIT